MVDDEGRALVKICEDEDNRDEDARREMNELHEIDLPPPRNPISRPRKPPEPNKKAPAPKQEATSVSPVPSNNSSSHTRSSANVMHLDEMYKRRPSPPTLSRSPKPAQAPPSLSCPICSLLNDQGAITCAACSNVLRPHLMAGYWSCKSEPCKDSTYINAGDAGVCGVCGAVKFDWRVDGRG